MARQDNARIGFSIPGIILHPAFLFLVATGLTIGCSVFVWGKYQSQIVDNSDFLLDESHFHIQSTPPPWAKGRLSKLVLEHFDEQPSLLDEALVTNTSMALHKVGYVRQVQRVQKSRIGLEIDVVYRQPVGLVQLSHGSAEPVDSQAVLMPRESVASAEELDSIMRISVFRPAPHNGLWNIWPDERIMDAAAICGAIEIEAKQLGLFRVVSWQRPDRNATKVPFEIWTKFGGANVPNGKVVWGNAPGKEVDGEASFEEKIAAIQKFVAENGDLPSGMPRMKVNVMSGRAVLVVDERVAEHGELFRSLK